VAIWPWRHRFGPGRPTSEFDASNAATVLSYTYGSPNTETVVPSFASYAEQAYAGNAIVFALILARMALFSEAEFQFQRRSDKALFGNQDLGILEAPWPNGTTGELLGRMQQDSSLAGNSYVRNVDDVMLERLRPDRITIASELLRDSQGRPYRIPIGYGYDRDGIGRVTEYYTTDEVIHWSPIPDPCASFRGMSWLTPVVREINADQGMTDYKISYLEHGATPNMKVVYEKQLKPDTITSIENRLEARHGGAGNAGKTIVLDMGADVSVVGNSFEEMSFVTVQAAGENRIAAAAGVPGIVVGLKEGLQAATYSNFSQAMRRFADLWARPEWRSACAALAPLVNVPAGARLWYDVRGISALQAGEVERAQVLHEDAQTAQVLVLAGFEPASITAAIQAHDLTMLVHTGRVPTSLYQDQAPAVPALNGKTPAAIGAN
jgi:phage portal protein BeeE